MQLEDDVASDDLTVMLQKAYQDEWETVANYISAASSLAGRGNEDVSHELLEISNDEKDHMEEFAEMLDLVKERPPLSIEMSPEERIFDAGRLFFETENIIPEVIRAEEDAIDFYGRIEDKARQEGFDVMADRIAWIIDDEEQHRDQFREFQRRFL